MARADFRFGHALRVRWAEVDPQGIVFNPNYLMYADVAAGEYWRAIEHVYPAGFHKHGVDTFVVKATLEFKAPARYDDDVDVLARIARIGRTSLRMLLEVHRGDDPLVNIEIVYVIASVDARTPTPIPESMRDAIVRYEAIAPEQA